MVGKGNAGKNFIAITDPGSSLARLAQAEGFRKTFENPPDIGGRYSVLSYFGLVPAALSGINISALLAGADRMREGCLPCVPTQECSGIWLGACMGTLNLLGRDKLTLLTSPAIASFGLWVEQLLAESTGKEGKGIVPVAGEPVMEKEHYGRDRFFVCLRLDGDDNSVLDTAIENIKSDGQPVIVLEMWDKTDIGAEFYRWEFATAIAGAILGIHPFDQPDVQAAKDATERVLQEYTVSGNLPQVEEGSLAGLLAQVEKGRYMAILAYLHQTPETDRLLTDLRRRIAEKYSIATTLGYGPRYLHSTGQLHKGGPDKGLFLQISANHGNDIDIPGKTYSFGIVAEAQALGDFQALHALGRHVARIHIDGNINTAISKMLKVLA
ncbi:glucose-6-phosphate isomerase [Chloroflexota bacterium]